MGEGTTPVTMACPENRRGSNLLGARLESDSGVEKQKRGKISIDNPAQGNPCNTLPPSERRGLWAVGIVYVRTSLYSLRFITWVSREMRFLRYARASVSVKETLDVRFEPVTWTTSNVNVLSTAL